MLKILFSSIILSLHIISIAQLSIKDSLIAATVYDKQFKPVSENTEKWLSTNLQKKNLSTLVNDKIISREDMRDLALPLGVFKNNDKINFTKGMLDMWKMKAARIKRKSKTPNPSIMLTALEGIESCLKDINKTSLSDYREKYITPATTEIKNIHSKIKPKYSKERADFMELIAKNLSPNVMLGFNIQELLPPTHLLENGKIESINPVFKAYYFERLLLEAGTEFIHYYPARYDVINSYGPFQLTPVAIVDVQANDRLIDEFKKFKSMDNLNSINDHILMSTIFAYNNWERLSMLLKHDGTLKKFNDYFRDYKTDNNKKRELRIFISGITACMHHNPPRTWKMTRNYLKSNKSLKNVHYKCIEDYGNKQLKKYYRSSVEAYLIMKVYHELFP